MFENKFDKTIDEVSEAGEQTNFIFMCPFEVMFGGKEVDDAGQNRLFEWFIRFIETEAEA